MNQFEMKQRAYQSSLKSRALQVLLYLIDRANREQTCFPAVPTIGRELHISISTVKRAMKELVESGYVTKESRFRDGNRGQTSNLYTLFFPEWELEQEKREDHVEKTEPEKENAEELAEVAESIGAQQDVELEFVDMLETEQAEHMAAQKEKAEYTEPVVGVATSGVIEIKKENVSGESAVCDRDSALFHNVDGGGVHSAIPLNCPFNQKLKAKKKYYREFRGRSYTCYAGKHLMQVRTKKQRSKSGYESEVAIYECEDRSSRKEKCMRVKKSQQLYVFKSFIEKRLKDQGSRSSLPLKKL